MFAPFDWTALHAWTLNLIGQVPGESDLARLKVLEKVCLGELPPELAPVNIPPLPTEEWLFLPDGALREQVWLALGKPPTPSEAEGWILPACAMVACREYQLELAADLLRLMLHLRIAGPVPLEVAEFLAFQQRPGGECGYLNPLQPSPFAPQDLFSQFTLPTTYAIAHALRVYAQESFHVAAD